MSWLTGFLIASVSLIYTVRHFRVQKTTSYIERLNSPEMAKVRSVVNQWLDEPNSELDKIKIANQDKHLEVQLKIFFDVFTELGIAYKYKSISRRLTREIFFPMIPKYWKKMQFYIYSEQLKGHKTGYWFKYLATEIDHFEKRNKKLMRKRYKRPITYYSLDKNGFTSIDYLKNLSIKESELQNNQLNQKSLKMKNES